MKEQTFLSKIGFTPCFEFISKYYPANIDRILGRIWSYCNMGNDDTCYAKVGTIASDLGISYSSVIRGLMILKEEEFIIDLTPELRNHSHHYKVNENKLLEFAEKYALSERQSTSSERTTGSITETDEQIDKLKDDSIDKKDIEEKPVANAPVISSGQIDSLIEHNTKFSFVDKEDFIKYSSKNNSSSVLNKESMNDISSSTEQEEPLSETDLIIPDAVEANDRTGVTSTPDDPVEKIKELANLGLHPKFVYKESNEMMRLFPQRAREIDSILLQAGY